MIFIYLTSYDSKRKFHLRADEILVIRESNKDLEATVVETKCGESFIVCELPNEILSQIP